MHVEVRELCDKIDGLIKKYNGDPHELLYEKVFLELFNLKFSGIFATYNSGSPLPLYRIRLNEKANEYFKLVSDIQHAPNNCVGSFGRVNRPNQSMFYCSEHENICELELLYDYLKKNISGHQRYATYSQWEIQESLNLLVLAIAPNSREFVNGVTYREDCYDFIKSQKDEHKVLYQNFYDLTEYYFLQNAKEQPSIYIVCSAISNFFLLHYPDIDGFIYPTVQGNTGYNTVLRPHTIDKRMVVPKELVLMKRWIIKSEDAMEIDRSFSCQGKIKGDAIDWIS